MGNASPRDSRSPAHARWRIVSSAGALALVAVTAGATAASCGGKVLGDSEDGGVTTVDAGRKPGSGPTGTSTGPMKPPPPPPELDADSQMCPAPVDPAQLPTWKAPHSSPGACSAQDLAMLNAAFQDQNSTFQSIYDLLKGSPACQACVWSNEGDSNWQPLVWSPDMASGNAIVNYGACYATAPGGSLKCGKAVQDDEDCFEAACPYDLCTDQQGCYQTAQTTSCGTYDNALTGACGNALQTLDSSCQNLGIDVLCGGADGG